VFSQFGEIASCTIARDHNGESRLFGFVSFACPTYAGFAVNSLHQCKEAGVTWYVSRAQKRDERESVNLIVRQQKEADWKCRNLLVSNLSDNIDENALRDLASKYGAVESAKVSTKERMFIDESDKLQRERVSKGFGYVCYHNNLDAARAVTVMNGLEVDGQKIRVTWWRPRKEVQRTKRYKERTLRSRQRKEGR
jgi:polyadenylate-binding protein